MANDGKQQKNQTGVQPDAETVYRIENLAIVGKSLMSLGYSERTYGTDQYAAMESLNRFEDGINRLDLSPTAKQGMHDLIEYLREKIKKRMRQANTDESLG